MPNLLQGITLGWVPPKSVLQHALKQIEGLLGPPGGTAIFEPFKSLGSAIPAAERQALRQQAAKSIAERAQPTLRTLRAFINAPLGGRRSSP